MLWQRGHFWIAIAGAILCVFRARFFLFDVRRFGTAIVDFQFECRAFSGQLAADCPQRVPTAFSSCGSTVARPAVQFNTTGRTQTFAVIPAKNEARDRQQPKLPDCGTQIERMRVRIERIDVRIIRAVVTFRRKNEMRLLVNRCPNLLQAPAARHFCLATDLAAEVKARGPG